MVRDTVGNLIPLAVLQLSKEGKWIGSGQTNAQGKFTINTQGHSYPYQLKVQHLNFISQVLEVNSPNLEIVLASKITKLDPLLIQKQKDVVVVGDTLKFNLLNLLNGSEVLLRHVLEKLPGLTVDDNNKIRYNGKIIDHFLLDGTKFFGPNHQIPLENISSAMVEGVALINKFKDLSHLEGVDQVAVSALDVRLKPAFQMKLKGNATAAGGYNNRYQVNANLFQYNKAFKVHLLTNSNNVNMQVFSVLDYIALRDKRGSSVFEEGFTGGLYTKSSGSLPSFMSATDDSKMRNIQNATLNFAKNIGEHKRLEIISTANKIQQWDASNTVMEFLGTSVNPVYNSIVKKGSSVFWSNAIVYENRWTPNNYYQLNAYSLITKDAEDQQRETFLNAEEFTNSYQLKNSIENLNVGISGLVKNKIADKVGVESGFYIDYIQAQTDNVFESLYPFSWEMYENRFIDQQTEVNQLQLGIMSSIGIPTSIGVFKLRYQSGLQSELLTNSSVVDAFNFNNPFYHFSHGFQFKYSKSFAYRLQIHAQFRYAWHQIQVPYHFTKNVAAFLPQLQLVYPVFKFANLAVSYGHEMEGFGSMEFLRGPIIQDFRSYTTASTLLPQLLKSEVISGVFVYHNVPKNLNLRAVYSRSARDTSISYRSDMTPELTVQHLNYMGGNLFSNTHFSGNIKFYDFPFGLDSDVKYQTIAQEVYVNSELNKTKHQTQEYQVSMRSYFKDPRLNFNLGIKYQFNTMFNTTQESESKLTRVVPFAVFNGVLAEKKLLWEVNNRLHLFKTSYFETTPIYDLGFKFTYTPNAFLSCFVHAVNVFNTRQNNFKNQFVTQDLFTQQIQVQTLSGYFNLGVKYNF